MTSRTPSRLHPSCQRFSSGWARSLHEIAQSLRDDAQSIVQVMANTAHMIELPEGLRAFAEEQVRAGKAKSVEEVVLDAVEQKRLEALREALDVGIAQADAGNVVQGPASEIMDRICQRHGATRGE